jgi:methyl-accepting chemotaxis protein
MAHAFDVTELRKTQAKEASLATLVQQALAGRNSMNQASLPEYVQMVELQAELHVLEIDLAGANLTPEDAAKLVISYREEVEALTGTFRRVGDNIVALSKASNNVATASLINGLFGSGWSKWETQRDLNRQNGAISDGSSSVLDFAAAVRKRLEQLDATLSELASQNDAFKGVSNEATSEIASAKYYVVRQVQTAQGIADQGNQDRSGCMWAVAIGGVVALILLALISSSQ